MLPFEERDTILKSMEEHNSDLTKAFKKFRKTENIAGPEFDENEDIDPKAQQFLVESYYNHKKALENILKCAGNLKSDINNIERIFKEGKKWQLELEKKLNERPKVYTQENIRDVFYSLLNHFVLGGRLIAGGNVLEKNNLVVNFKIGGGIIYGDTLDLDGNTYSSSIDMNLLRHRQKIIERIENNDINLANILKILNELKIEIIPENFYKLNCKCSCATIEQPCKHTIALYFRFIDNIKINRDIVIELFGIK